MQEHVEFFKMYDPLRQRFTSMHQRFKTIEHAIKEFKYYQERVTRGIRLDTADLIKRQIIVRINKDNDVLESYCSECGGIVDASTAKIVCQQCPRVIDLEDLHA